MIVGRANEGTRIQLDRGESAMTKGYRGESCADAIRSVIRQGEVVTFTQLVERTQPLGEWRENTLWRHLMAVVVNLLPARYEWPSKRPFLFLRPDARYELYDAARHPQPIERE